MRVPILNIELNDTLFRVFGFSITGVTAIGLAIAAFLLYRYWFGIPLRILGFNIV